MIKNTHHTIHINQTTNSLTEIRGEDILLEGETKGDFFLVNSATEFFYNDFTEDWDDRPLSVKDGVESWVKEIPTVPHTFDKVVGVFNSINNRWYKVIYKNGDEFKGVGVE